MSQPNHWKPDMLNTITPLKSYRDEYRCLFAYKVNPPSCDSAHITAVRSSRRFDPASHLDVVQVTSATAPLKIIIISRAVDIMNCDNALLAPSPTVKTFYNVGYSLTDH